MSKELVIASNRHETKVAILEDDQLAEIYFQRANEYSLAGSIHKGRVTRVLPGMQSAFVDLGLERDTFLYVSDFFEENEDIDTLPEDKATAGRDRASRQPFRTLPIDAAVATEDEAEPIAATPDPQPAQVAPLTEVLDRRQIQESPGVDRPTLDRQAAERQANDRNFRGDRRGRRSRRRRSRGGGFPENKYAQPGGQAAVASPEPGETEDEYAGESEPARDLIILPGESLAKYRHLAPSAEAEPEQGNRQLEPSPTPDQDEGIAAEAQELELADKVFSHAAESPVEEEEKLQEVRNDQPASPFIVSDIEESEADEEAAEQEDPRPAVLGGVTAETELAKAEPFETEDFSESETEPPEAGDFRAPVEEDHWPPIAEGGPAPELAQAQTATVRESGGRYLHRVPRRMRRRRGNRPNQQEGVFETRSGGPAAAALGPQPAEARQESEDRSADRGERPLPSITELLKPGQEIIVQIAKEPLGQKGARITSHVALPGRYVVFMPSVNHVGVSRKIASDEERQRLKRILQTHRVGTTGGFIVRTAGEGVSEEEIAADMDFLYRLWMDIRQKAEKRPAPALLHCDLDVVQRVLRDQVTEEFKSIWLDNEDMYENVLSFMQRFQPALVNRVKMYTRSAPIFDAFGITQELEKALRPKVWLKSGGYIVINQTEALVAIDINTGKYVGKSNRLEDTIVKTNLEAVKEIVRQIRLRDLGGIIVVDFIDMDERKNRQKVMQALEEAMRADRAPYKILQFNDFGLVAITRKRVKQSLERTLCSPCPYCEAAGYVKSVQTVIGEILIEAQKLAKAIEGKDVLLRVHPEVAKVLKANDNHYLEEIEESLSKPVLVKGDPSLHIEKFDLG